MSKFLPRKKLHIDFNIFSPSFIPSPVSLIIPIKLNGSRRWALWMWLGKKNLFKFIFKRITKINWLEWVQGLELRVFISTHIPFDLTFQLVLYLVQVSETGVILYDLITVMKWRAPNWLAACFNIWSFPLQ